MGKDICVAGCLFSWAPAWPPVRAQRLESPHCLPNSVCAVCLPSTLQKRPPLKFSDQAEAHCAFPTVHWEPAHSNCRKLLLHVQSGALRAVQSCSLHSGDLVAWVA